MIDWDNASDKEKINRLRKAIEWLALEHGELFIMAFKTQYEPEDVFKERVDNFRRHLYSILGVLDGGIYAPPRDVNRRKLE